MSVRHPVFARLFVRLEAASRSETGEHRDRLLAGLSGRVLEVGAGHGANFARYPSTVTEVVAVEPEPYLRGKAVEAARSAPVPVSVVDGLADALPAGDGEFDAVVLSLVLCSVPDPAAALREARRVLRTGGEARVYEHVVARNRMALAQRLVAPVWSRLFGGCRPDRDTVAALTAAGLAIESLDRFVMWKAAAASPHVLVRARAT